MKKTIVSFVAGAALMLTATVYAVNTTFNDVNQGDWFYNDVAKLAEWGVSEGYSDGTFKPGNNVTRAELAAMFNRYNEHVKWQYEYAFEQLIEDYSRYKNSYVLWQKKVEKDLFDAGISSREPNCLGFDGLRANYSFLLGAVGLWPPPDSPAGQSIQDNYDSIEGLFDECMEYVY